MARITPQSLNEAAQLLGYSQQQVRQLVEKLWNYIHGARVSFTPEERKLLIAAMYLNNPFAYKVDLTRPAEEPGNPWTGAGDIPGVDTPDAKAFAEKVIRELEAKMRQRLYGQRSLLEYLKPSPPRIQQFGAKLPPARQATAVVKPQPPRQPQARPKESEEVERFLSYSKWLLVTIRQTKKKYSEELAKGTASLAEYALLLASYAEKLRNQIGRGRRLYEETRDARVEEVLQRLGSQYEELVKTLRKLAEQAVEEAEKQAEKYAGMKLGLKWEMLVEQLRQRLAEAKTPRDYAMIVEKLSEEYELEHRAQQLRERAATLRREALEAARELEELAEKVREKAPSLAEEMKELIERLQELATKEPDIYVEEKAPLLIGRAKAIAEEARQRLREAAQKTIVMKPAPPARKPKWPPEVIRLADYLWENIPPKARRKWNYIQVLQLARLIITKAREKGVDPYGIDWAHEIDWSLGYSAAKEKVLSMLGSTSTPSEKELEKYMEYMERQAEMQPIVEEAPPEWEVRSWELAHLYA